MHNVRYDTVFENCKQVCDTSLFNEIYFLTILMVLVYTNLNLMFNMQEQMFLNTSF